MARRTALLAALGAGLLAATPAAGDNSAKIAALHARIAAARQKESALSSQVSSITAQIRSLEGKVGDVSQRLSLLERDLALHRERLAKLSALFTLETNRLHFLQRQYARSVTLLNRRVVQIYEEPNATVADVILSAKSVQDAIDTLHYLTSIAQLDNKIAHAVRAARDEVDVAREKTKKARTVVASETQVVAIRTQQQREVKDRLLASEHKLSGLRGSKRQALASTKQQEQDLIAEADALAAADARIRSQLAAAQSHSSSATDTTPSSSGLIWPVSGPVISPFGMRWGRLHAGIDIAVPSGTPIHAAAAGTVVIAGWVGGYGNYTCIDHGGGLATCYAHQQSFAVGVGAHVAQGQVIGYTDCTGHCLGPHLHFEVRINGTPVDPLGYL